MQDPRKSLLFFGIALVLHAILFGVFSLSYRSEFTPGGDVPHDAIVLDAEPGPKGEAAPPAPSSPLSMQDLMKGEAAVGTLTEKAEKEDEHWNFQKDFGLERAGELHKFLNRIWGQIDSHLDYPHDFADERIEGHVTVKLVLDKTGIPADASIASASRNALLEAYVLAIVAASLKEPIPTTYWANRDRVPVILNFSFHVETERVEAVNNRGGIARNVLEFERHKQMEGKINEALHRIYKKLVPPIIIIPGGFMIDFVHLYQMIQEWKAPSPGEMRRSRLDMLRRYLKATAGKPPEKTGTP